MNPLASYAASWAAGKLLGGLSPNRARGANKRLDAATSQLSSYERSYQDLADQGRMDSQKWAPRRDAAVEDQISYLSANPDQEARDAADIAQANEGIQRDSKRLTSRTLRALPLDSEGTGAASGALVAGQDAELSAMARLRSQVLERKLARREQAKSAIVDLITRQLARGQQTRMAGMAGGASLASQRLGVASGQSNLATQLDQQDRGGWLDLAQIVSNIEERRSQDAEARRRQGA